MTEREDQQLVDFLYDELSEQEAEAFEERAARDPARAGEVRELTAALETLRSIDLEEEPPSRLDGLILAHARQAAEKAAEAPSWWRKLVTGPWVGLATAGVAALFVAVIAVPQVMRSPDLDEASKVGFAPPAPAVATPPAEPAAPLGRVAQLAEAPAPATAASPGALGATAAGSDRNAQEKTEDLRDALDDGEKDRLVHGSQHKALPPSGGKADGRVRGALPAMDLAKAKPTDLSAGDVDADKKPPTNEVGLGYSGTRGQAEGAGGAGLGAIGGLAEEKKAKLKGGERREAPAEEPEAAPVAAPPAPPPAASAPVAPAPVASAPKASAERQGRKTAADETVASGSSLEDRAAGNERSDDATRSGGPRPATEEAPASKAVAPAKKAEATARPSRAKDDAVGSAKEQALDDAAIAAQALDQAARALAGHNGEQARSILRAARARIPATKGAGRLSLRLAQLEVEAKRWVLARAYAREALRDGDPTVRAQAEQLIRQADLADAPR